MLRSTTSPTLDVFAPELGELERESSPVEKRPRLGEEEHSARLAELLHAHFRDVWRVVRRFGVPEAAADDATQEVFIIASRKLEQIEPGRERRFLHSVAVRVAANARRAREVRPEHAESPLIDRLLSPGPSPEAALDQKQTRALLDAVLDELGDDLRAVFVLFELEGYSGPEVAELCEIPLGTATSRLRRAREAFSESVARLRLRLDRGAAR